MSTAGQDFFDKDFFQHNVVLFCNYPISKMKWYGSINNQIISEWKEDNIVNDIEEKIARSMLDNFSADLLALPMLGESKIKHYFEKILWLIQSYCIVGWKNPIKGINHLDNGIIIIHPGTNRCVAAKFLNCLKLSVIINVHKDQHLLQCLKDAELIDNEESLRKLLVSEDTILFRTETTEELWINGCFQPGVVYKDFTYEFLGKDSWPDPTDLKEWNSIVLNSLPLTIYVEKETDTAPLNIASKQTTSLTFKSIIEYGVEKKLEYKFLEVLSFEEIDDTNTFIFISKNSKFKKNIFELLYFLSPKHEISRTLDSSIIIKNSFVQNKKELIIPEHYVNS
jgi:hypothetical protein